MRFLVTGGAGFLGAALANHLVRGDHQVRVLDDLSAGNRDRLHERVLFTRGDVADRPKLWTLLQDVDCVYHLAARVQVPESILYPREYNEVNVGGTVSVMEAMRDAGVRRVVFTSSGAVYGEQAEQPVREDQIPNPQSPYAVSKLAAEYYVRTIGALWGIETVILRVFVYMDDVVEALAAAATASDVDRRTVNVGTGRATSINGLVALVGEVAGRELEVLHSPAESGGVSRLCADISIARRLLEYEPRIDLAEGLRLTLERDPRFRLEATS